jgi:serine/threonine protein kinase
MSSVADFNRIAGFRFVQFLGSGSFANTYKAERDGERFAVKVFHELPVAAGAQKRFSREVSSLRISHPNLVEYVESGISMCGGRAAAYIAMRYCRAYRYGTGSLLEGLSPGSGPSRWRGGSRRACTACTITA